MQTGTYVFRLTSYFFGLVPGPTELVMDAFSELVAMTTGVESTISPKIWLIPKDQEFRYVGICGFLHPFLHPFSNSIIIIWVFGICESRPQTAFAHTVIAMYNMCKRVLSNK